MLSDELRAALEDLQKTIGGSGAAQLLAARRVHAAVGALAQPAPDKENDGRDNRIEAANRLDFVDCGERSVNNHPGPDLLRRDDAQIADARPPAPDAGARVTALIAAVRHYCTETFVDGSGQRERAYRRMEAALFALDGDADARGESGTGGAERELSRWRWNGDTWEHKCQHAQAGYFEAVPTSLIVAVCSGCGAINSTNPNDLAVEPAPPRTEDEPSQCHWCGKFHSLELLPPPDGRPAGE